MSTRPIDYAPAFSLFMVGFLLTGLVGIWAAYDRPTALIHFGWLGFAALVALMMIYFGRRRGSKISGWVAVVCSGLAVMTGLLYGVLGGEHSGALASTIIVLVPLGLGGLAWCVRQHPRLVRVVAGALVLALLLMILMREASAWTSLAAGLGVAALYYWRTNQPVGSFWRRLLDISALVLAGLFVVVAGLLLWTTHWDAQLAQLPFTHSLLERLTLWRDTVPLIRDYWYTGSGLGNTGMVYSTYIFLLHTVYIQHAHNLFLQIAVEQGMPGLVFFLALVGLTIQRLIMIDRGRQPSTRMVFATAATGSLATLLIYGLQDAELYAAPVLPVLFLPFAFAWARPLNPQCERVHLQRWSGALLVMASLGLLIAVLFGADAHVMMQTNLGSVAQTRTELRDYSYQQWGLQDSVRRSRSLELASASQYFDNALAWGPNATAHRRLGQLALANGDFATAREHLEAAYALAPAERPTRQLLGEVYALAGDAAAAAALWRTIDLDEGQLQVRIWWYQQLKANEAVARMQVALTALKDEP